MKIICDPSITDEIIANFTSNYHCCDHTWIKLDDLAVIATRYPHPLFRTAILTSEFLRSYDQIRAGTEKFRSHHIAIMIDVFSSRRIG